MLTKCKCNSCSANIEFDRDGAGATVSCPHCGLETILYVSEEATNRISAASCTACGRTFPPTPEQVDLPYCSECSSGTPPAARRKRARRVAETVSNPNVGLVQSIRLGTSYKALRNVLEYSFAALMALVLVAGGFTILGAVVSHRDETVAVAGLIVAATAIVTAIAFYLLRAMKEASLLLVDIADCAVLLVAASKETNLRPPIAEETPVTGL